MDDPEFDFESEAGRLIMAVQFLDGVNLQALLDTVGKADALGPIIDPTRYRDMLYRKTGNMHDIARLAREAGPLVKLFREIREKVTTDA